MNNETLKYCAYLKEDQAYWKEMLSLASELIHGTNSEWDISDGEFTFCSGKAPSENPEEEFPFYFSFPDWDEDLKHFSKDFLLKVNPKDVANIVCDAANGGFYLKEDHAKIDKLLDPQKTRILFLHTKINSIHKLKFEEAHGFSLLDASSEPGAAA